MKKQAPNLDPFWNFWARWEIEKGKMILFFLIVGVILLIGDISQGITIRTQAREIAYLSQNRVMYGFPNQDGVLVSGEGRPLQLVQTYARMFINNVYDWDAASVMTNSTEAIKMLDSRVRSGYADTLIKHAQESKAQGIQQFFTPSYVNVQSIKGGYQVTFEGYKTSYGAGIRLGKDPVRIVVTLAKISPTATRYAGLSVMGVHEYPIKRPQK